MQQIKRTYKDGVFRKVFSDKESLIELYNALSGRNYSKETELEIVTLENSIFGDIKNDLAFIIDNHFIILIEHQSTINPNMPLRMLSYIPREYERRGFTKELYSRRQVKVPTPELYVFYNGTEDQPVEQELKLSDAFQVKCDKISLEVSVSVINVNYEKGAEVLKKCRRLEEYSRFIQMIRSKREECGDLNIAVRESVKLCMKAGILKEFLEQNGGEIMSFINIELTREECEAIREKDGYLRGLEEGESKEKIAIACTMLKMGMAIKMISEATGLTEEEISKLR